MKKHFFLALALLSPVVNASAETVTDQNALPQQMLNMYIEQTVESYLDSALDTMCSEYTESGLVTIECSKGLYDLRTKILQYAAENSGENAEQVKLFTDIYLTRLDERISNLTGTTNTPETALSVDKIQRQLGE